MRAAPKGNALGTANSSGNWVRGQGQGAERGCARTEVCKDERKPSVELTIACEKQRKCVGVSRRGRRGLRGAHRCLEQAAGGRLHEHRQQGVVGVFHCNRGKEQQQTSNNNGETTATTSTATATATATATTTITTSSSNSNNNSSNNSNNNSSNDSKNNGRIIIHRVSQALQGMELRCAKSSQKLVTHEPSGMSPRLTSLHLPALALLGKQLPDLVLLHTHLPHQGLHGGGSA